MKRYPGIRPFRNDEKGLFFGRDADIERLYRLIDLEQLVILYGKSGYGKSSLLSAGIFPRLQAEGRRQYREIRFGPYNAGESLPPADNARQALQNPETAPVRLIPNAEPSLWLSLKTRQQSGLPGFLLVFDQFEELFSYPADQVLEFKKQLAEALYSIIPKRYETALAGAGLPPEQEDALYAPLDLKVVFSIRSDRMSQLNGLKDYLPNLLQHGYELEALDEAAAEAAVCRPATLDPREAADAFDTPPFAYAPDALTAIFAALRDERGRIETSTLQIVCRYVEDYVAGPNTRTVALHDLGDIKSIFRQFYERTLDSLNAAERAPARRLVEDLLIKDGVRIPYAAQALLAVPGVTQDLLERLAAASLLRVERDEQGRMLYEVGHDTLVAPISEAAQARRDEEEKRRLQREADEQRREKEKAVAARRKARLVAAGAVLLALIAMLASYLAYLKSNEAKAKAAIIIEKEKQVEENVRIAKEKTADAAAALKRAEEKEEEARQKNDEVQRLKDATEEQKRRAAQALFEAQAERRRAEEATAKVVQSLMADASAAIRGLDYETARERLHAAADLCRKKPIDNPLGSLRPALADLLMEPAYFLNESGNFAGAMFETGMIAMTLEAHDPADTLRIDDRTPEGRQYARDALRAILHALRPAAFLALQKKYYPALLPVPGGEFWMGCDSTRDGYCNNNEIPLHRVRLRDYEMAETETTVWQYNLYLADQGKDIFDDKTIPRPGWGWEGDNPIVNVSWFDACLYANWLSRRFGLKEVYNMGVLKEDTLGNYYENITADAAAGGIRLPSEAGWEFAARGGGASLRDSFTYAGGNEMKHLGWYSGNSGNRTRTVAQFLPNRLGLYDMSGNAWEWVEDDYYDNYTNAPADGRAWVDSSRGMYRVHRGGCWRDDPRNCRAVSRYRFQSTARIFDLGFRLARSSFSLTGLPDSSN